MRRGFSAAIAAFVLLSMPVPGRALQTRGCSQASHSCFATDSTGDVIEPILTRSSEAPIRTGQASLAANRLANANIVAFTLQAAAGFITATITTQGAIVHDQASSPAIAPYSGQHFFALFQTVELEKPHVIPNCDVEDCTTVPPGYNADGFRWFVYYGWTADSGESCGLGYYDPTGEVAPPVPVPFGQTFFVIGVRDPNNVQQPTATCDLSDADRTVTIRIPYIYRYSDRTGLNVRRLPVVLSGETVSNASAFSWMDQDIGSTATGLLWGNYWYTDAVPSWSYRYGVVAGDPNPAVIAGPKCLTNPDGDPVSGPPGPCTIPNPIGPGFVNTGLTFVAG